MSIHTIVLRNTLYLYICMWIYKWIRINFRSFLISGLIICIYEVYIQGAVASTISSALCLPGSKFGYLLFGWWFTLLLQYSPHRSQPKVILHSTWMMNFRYCIFYNYNTTIIKLLFINDVYVHVGWNFAQIWWRMSDKTVMGSSWYACLCRPCF